METLKLKIELQSSDTSVPLGIRVYFDNNCIFEINHVKDVVNVDYDFNDDPGKHSFKIEMFGKLAEHTKLVNGEIIKDALIEVKKFTVDDLDLHKYMCSKGTYYHDYNGTGEKITDKFYGIMGCNGSVNLEVECPFYIWLLENM